MLPELRHFWVRRPSAVRRGKIGRPPRRGRNAFRPEVEALEPRQTPAVTFSAPQTFAAVSGVQEIASADFNGDGRPDLVVANGTSNSVSVLLNTTPAGAVTPTFAPQQTFAAGLEPNWVAVADFNGDGRPDLAVVNLESNTVSVLLNTTPAGAGTPTFAPQQTFAVGSLPQVVVAADLNGDGKPDLAVVNLNDHTVSVLLDTTPGGAGTPTFAPQQTFTTHGLNTEGLAVGDFNGDGRPDLATADFGDFTVSVLLNTTPAGAGAASFAPPKPFAVGGGAQGVAAADLNGDGRPDLVVANSIDNTVSVLLNTTPAGAGTLTFAPQQTFAVGASPFQVAVADLDGDGRPDLAVSNASANSVSVLLNTTAAGSGTLTFAPQQTFASGTITQGVVTADLNGDGRPDLAVSNGGAASVLLNTTAPFANTTPVVVGQFGTTGVWEFNQVTSTWVQLTPANANHLAADPLGDVAGAFKGFGVWLFKLSTGWKQIGTGDASLLAMDALGDVAGEFPGAGVWLFRPAAGFHQIGTGNASALAMDAQGDVVGTFPGAGVWLFRPAVGFQKIGTSDASVLTMDGLGDVIGTFPGAGVWEFRPSVGFQQTNTADATALAADPYGNVVASFAGLGVGQFQPSVGWHILLPGSTAAVLGMDALGDLFGAFPGFGVWEAGVFRFGTQLRNIDASLLVVA